MEENQGNALSFVRIRQINIMNMCFHLFPLEGNLFTFGLSLVMQDCGGECLRANVPCSSFDLQGRSIKL